jgi:hypothetical protein
MFSYETGVTIAVAIYFTLTLNTIILLNSVLEKNLNKIGYRLSRVTLSWKGLTSDFKNRSIFAKVLFWISFLTFGLLLTLLSWLYVFVFIQLLIYELNNRYGTPRNVLECRWKMRNVDMSFDQIVAEIVKSKSEESLSFDKFKSDLLSDMIERGLISEENAKHF